MNENKFEYLGRKYVAVEDKVLDEVCEKCAFSEWAITKILPPCGTLQKHGEIPPCDSQKRKDCKDVYFVDEGKANK